MGLIRVYLYRKDDGFLMPEYNIPPEQIVQTARADYPEYTILAWESLKTGMCYAVTEK